MEHRLSGVLTKLLRPDLAKLPRLAVAEEDFRSWIGEMPPEMYHGDRERMSSSAIRKILHSPRHFLAWWTGLEQEPDEEPDHFRFGRAAHMMLLEPERFRQLHLVEPKFTGLTKDGKESEQSKEAKEKRKAWRESIEREALIITEPEMESLIGMIESVLEHKIACNLLSKGEPEMTVHWTDEETKITCKGRPDYLVTDETGGLHIIDFKTTRDIRSGIFASEIRRHKYYVQLAFYHDGIMKVYGKQPQSLTIVAVEKSAPYECAVHILDDKWFERGQEEYRHALRIYQRCVAENKWPAYQQNATMLSAPGYLDYDQLPEFDFQS